VAGTAGSTTVLLLLLLLVVDASCSPGLSLVGLLGGFVASTCRQIKRVTQQPHQPVPWCVQQQPACWSAAASLCKHTTLHILPGFCPLHAAEAVSTLLWLTSVVPPHLA
jgi:hypothetical protein